MFGNVGRMLTIVGAGCAMLVAGEVMLGEKSTPISHDPELRAMERSPGFASGLKSNAVCIYGSCREAKIVAPVYRVGDAVKPQRASVHRIDSY